MSNALQNAGRAPADDDSIIDTTLGDDFDYGDGNDSFDQVFEQERAQGDGLADGEDRSAAGEQESQQQSADDGQGSREGTQRTSVPQVNAQQSAEEQPLPGLKRVGSAFADAKGNIVDAKGGMIAPNGAAARLWSKSERLNSQVEQLTRQNSALQQQSQQASQLLQQAQEIASLPQKLGITKEDYNEAITLLANFREKPLDVAKDVVARVMALGYNATDILGNSASDAIEMRALARMQQEFTAPMRQQREREMQEQQRVQQAESQYNAFIARYPDATVHEEAIANLMTRNGMPPVDAYFAVKQFALENQLDFGQPLGPQIQAKQANAQAGQRQNTTGQQRKPMPNGGRGTNDVVTSNPQMASADSDWGSIISNALADGQ